MAPPAAWWQESAAPAEQVAPPAASPVDAPGEPDLTPMVQADFTQIEGIGPKLNQRLHAANIRTFADLIALPPETLAGILGWTSERVLRSGVLEQAQRLVGK